MHDRVEDDARPGAAAAYCEPSAQASGAVAGGAIAAALSAALAACGGGAAAPSDGGDGGGVPPGAIDTARFLTQATFGLQGAADISAVQQQGFAAWLATQFGTPAASHVAYLDAWAAGRQKKNPDETASYEAIWQQWLHGNDQLRARVAWALVQIFVISNIAPDIRPYAMSSYMDMLNRNAFGNYRQLLEDVTLHPAMGYYLTMLASEKEDPDTGTHPNENYAREVLQLFSIGLVKLNLDGTPQLANNLPVPTYDQTVVQGFAKAFSGWGMGAQDNSKPAQFRDYNVNNDANWVTPMKPWATFHDTSSKTLLDGQVLPAGQTAQQDMTQALDVIFHHPNVGPFFCRELIQRLVTSNPSGAYLQRVATVFNDNGSGVRGDLKAVVTAILLDAEARGDDARGRPAFGKLREPVVRFANVLRALGAHSANGLNDIHDLNSADNGLGQSPLLAPSVFNFYSPNFRPAGPLAQAGMVAPEFQITGETTAVSVLNFFAALFADGGYGGGASRLELDLGPLTAQLKVSDTAMVDELERLFCNLQMSSGTRQRLTTLLQALAGQSDASRIRAALTLVAMSPDFIVQQ